MGFSAKSAQMKNLVSGIKSAMITSDEPVAIRLKYTGSGTVTSVVVDTNQDITLTTSDGGTDEFLLSTYTTMGALVDAINSTDVWEAELLDALRSDSTTSSPFVNDTGVTISTEGYYDCLIDTSVYQALTYRCKYDRNVGSAVPSGNHRVKLVEFTYYATLGNASANDVQIWEYDRRNNSETQVYQATSVNATATTTNFASGKSTISGGFNNDLIVRIVDDTSLADSGAYLQAQYVRE